MTSTKKKTSELTQLTRLLGEIRDADIKQVESQFHIANVLTAIRDHDLYASDGYESFKHMVGGELDFPYSAACRYCSLFNAYTRLNYKKEEFLKLMQRFGWRKLEKALSNSEKKLGMRAIQNRLDSDKTRDNQFNFNLNEPAVALRLETLLTQFGMETSRLGMRQHMTDSFLALLDDYDSLKAMSRRVALSQSDEATPKKRGRPKSKPPEAQLELASLH